MYKDTLSGVLFALIVRERKIPLSAAIDARDKYQVYQFVALDAENQDHCL